MNIPVWKSKADGTKERVFINYHEEKYTILKYED
jgi:hypothetical protein